MSRWIALLFAFTGTGSALADDALAPIRDAPKLEPISVKGRTGVPVVSFTRVVSTIPEQERTGEFRVGLFCSRERSYLWDVKTLDLMAKRVHKYAQRELEAAGYRTVKKNESAFDTPTAEQKADFEIGAVLQAYRIDLCASSSSSSFDASTSVAFKWEVYDVRQQKVVASVVTEGSNKGESVHRASEADIEFIGRAVDVSIRNLLADREFVDVVLAHAGNTPVAAPGAADEALTIERVTARPGGVEANSTEIRAAVVTIQTSAGSGTGFYIDSQGYLLTANHVVGEAKFVKIKTATGRELPGEVVHTDVRRDVALLKTVPIPFPPLPLQPLSPAGGSEVFVVGSPLGDAFSGTITKGVVSAERVTEDVHFIQSDVSVLPGNSGGPLVNGSGEVLGICVTGLVLPNLGRAGVNVFVPIADALEAVHVKVK
jgi:serine protease Do